MMELWEKREHLIKRGEIDWKNASSNEESGEATEESEWANRPRSPVAQVPHHVDQKQDSLRGIASGRSRTAKGAPHGQISNARMHMREPGHTNSTRKIVVQSALCDEMLGTKSAKVPESLRPPIIAPCTTSGDTCGAALVGPLRSLTAS